MRIRSHFSLDERKTLAEKLMDLGNITLGALALTQAFAGKSFNLSLALAGGMLWLLLYSIALWLMTKGKEQS